MNNRSITQKFFLLIAVLTIFIAQSCNEEQSVAPSVPFEFNIQSQSQVYNIVSAADLTTYLTSLPSFEGKTIQSTNFYEAEDSEGKFYVVQGKFETKEGDITTVSIPLEMKNRKSTGSIPLLIGSGGCEMTCTAKPGCSGCEQTIHERCKRQTCDCKQSGGQCEGSIKFSDDR